MKTLILILFALLLQPLYAAEVVQRSGTEFFATGDFTGDGIPDLLVVDAETGIYRILYRQAGGVISSGPSRDSGVRGVSSVSLGRVHDLSRDSLILTGPDTNRVHLFQDTVVNAPAAPQVLPSTVGIGPHLAIALERMGDSPENEDSLFVYSAWNSSPAVHLRERFSGSTFSPIGVPQATEALRDGTPIRIKTTLEQVLAFLQTDSLGDDHLYILSFPAGGPSPLLYQPAPDNGMRYAYGFFGGNPIGTFLFYVPGAEKFFSQDLETSTLPITLLPPVIHTLTHAVTFLMPVEQGNGRILILDDLGKAYLYDFDGASAPVFLQQPSLPPGAAAFTSALSLPGNELILFSSPTLGGSSQTAHQYLFSGGQYVLQASHNLPNLPASLRANVVVYDGEPFVASAPRRLFSGRVADWTILAKLSAGQINVERDLDAGQPQGLVPGTGTLFGVWPVGGTHTLVNQMDNDISVISYETPLGQEAADVRLEPSAGTYAQAIQIRMRPVPAGTPIWYRTAPSGIWVLYNSPFWVAQPIQLQAFAKAAIGPNSPIRSATYDFSVAPADMDSDGDGVPDFVEIHKGLDPTAGFDSDGDGISDLEELVLGMNPAFADNPGALDRFETGDVFDLFVKPLPLHPLTGISGPATAGVTLNVWDLNGALVGSANTQVENCAGCGADPVGLLEALPADRKPPLLLLSTPMHFARVGDDEGNSTGRELLKLYLIPALPTNDVSYTYQGNSLAAEATAWVQAATSHLENLTRPEAYTELRPVDTLAALLLERRLGIALFERGLSESPVISLFPHRPNDADRFAPGAALLRTLRQPGPEGESAIAIDQHLTQLLQALESGLPQTQTLVALAQQVYEISAREHNAAPGVFGLPVDVLRTWLADGELPPAYLNVSTMVPADVTAAHAQAQLLLDDLPNRPLETRSLTFMETNGSCQIFMDLNGVMLTLLDANGRPFPLPLSFALNSGMVFLATGFTDVTSDCATEAMEVLSLVLTSVITSSGEDQDGNLLPDAWELLVFGQIDNDFLADHDSDGYSNLQEYFDETDPLDTHSNPSGPAVDLSLPEINLVVDDGLSIEWSWPAGYQNFVHFTLHQTSDLKQPFQNAVSTIEGQGNMLKISLPGSVTPDIHFYRIGISLK